MAADPLPMIVVSFVFTRDDLVDVYRDGLLRGFVASKAPHFMAMLALAAAVALVVAPHPFGVVFGCVAGSVIGLMASRVAWGWLRAPRRYPVGPGDATASRTTLEIGDDGIVLSGNDERRIPWAAVARVEFARSCLVINCGAKGATELAVPVRVFSRDELRAVRSLCRAHVQDVR